MVIIAYEQIVAVQFLYTWSPLFSQTNWYYWILFTPRIYLSFQYQFARTLMDYLISCVMGILRGYQKFEMNIM